MRERVRMRRRKGEEEVSPGQGVTRIFVKVRVFVLQEYCITQQNVCQRGNNGAVLSLLQHY